MVPGWPIAFGDNKKANQLLLTALNINPKGIDSKVFYGEYLLARGQNQAAASYFQKAVQAPSRPEQLFADRQLKAEAQLGLEKASKSRYLLPITPKPRLPERLNGLFRVERTIPGSLFQR